MNKDKVTHQIILFVVAFVRLKKDRLDFSLDVCTTTVGGRFWETHCRSVNHIMSHICCIWAILCCGQNSGREGLEKKEERKTEAGKGGSRETE